MAEQTKTLGLCPSQQKVPSALQVAAGVWLTWQVLT